MAAPRDLDCMLSVALHHSCAAADAEQRGNALSAAVESGKAADVLLFMLTAPQRLLSHQQPTGRAYPGAVSCYLLAGFDRVMWGSNESCVSGPCGNVCQNTGSGRPP